MLRDTYTKYPRSTLFVGGILLFGIGVGVGKLIPENAVFSPDDLVTREGGYALINPLLSCDIDEEVPYTQFTSLKNTLAETISNEKRSGEVTRVSVYFRDLDLGHWTGVNENDMYMPASLIKIPVLIGYLYDGRSDANLMTTTFTYTGENDQTKTQDIPPTKPLRPGAHSVEELLQSMIGESDNNAYDLLNNHLSTSTLGKVYSDFGVPPPSDANGEIASAKIYSRFFRILYNSSFLGRVRSQTALTFLSKTSFQNGIVAGVPNGTLVAHKYAERTIKDAGGNVVKRQLHDCGIVYYPRHPYSICVMTEGSDYSKMESAISAISKTAWNAVDQGLLSPSSVDD